MSSYNRTHNKYVMSAVTPFSFGKYKGTHLKDVIDTDPQYVEWCLDNVDWFDISKRCKKDLDVSLQEHSDANIDPEFDADFRDAYLSDMGDR